MGLQFVCSSQIPAPDFIITDTNGDVHHLYQDYLNNGKAVLLELFFTTCPPCNTIVPHVQNLYEDWGEGSGDVEFIELSIMGWDTNSKVLTHQVNHGLTFVGVGSDGGSLTASNPYKDGTYGPYYGTPTFIVISPDGTVNYNVQGPGIPETIEALDQAIQDALSVEEDTVQINVADVGTVYGSSIEDYKVFVISEQDSFSKEIIGSDSMNFISFSYPNDSLPLLIEPKVQLNKDGDDLNSVTTWDIVLIQKYILGFEPLSPFKILAADLNQSKTITAIDLLIMRKAILGFYENGFPFVDSWLFYNAACDPGEDVFDSDCVDYISIDIEATIQEMNFFGIKMGDVSY